MGWGCDVVVVANITANTTTNVANLDGNKVEGALQSDSLCEHGLGAARRTKEEDAGGGRKVGWGEEVGVVDGKMDGALEKVFEVLPAPDVLVRHLTHVMGT